MSDEKLRDEFSVSIFKFCTANHLFEDEFAYIRNPFTANAQMLKATTDMQEQLVELQHNGFAHDVHS